MSKANRVRVFDFFCYANINTGSLFAFAVDPEEVAKQLSRTIGPLALYSKDFFNKGPTARCLFLAQGKRACERSPGKMHEKPSQPRRGDTKNTVKKKAQHD